MGRKDNDNRTKLLLTFFSDCSTVKYVESTADAIIPVLDSIETNSSDVNRFISRTKRDITNIK